MLCHLTDALIAQHPAAPDVDALSSKEHAHCLQVGRLACRGVSVTCCSLHRLITLIVCVALWQGIIAAVGSIPLELIFPILMYMTYKAQQGVTLPFHIKAGLGIVVVICAGFAAIMLVASLYMIADSASSYKFFS